MKTTILGCEKYGTEVMKMDEVLLFLETAVENGSDVDEAIQDMRMIDALMKMKQLHLVVHGNINTTRAGNSRKGSSLSNSLISIIDGRVKGAF